MELVLTAPGDCLQSKYRNAWMAGIPRHLRPKSDEPRGPINAGAQKGAMVIATRAAKRREALAPECLRLNREGNSIRAIGKLMNISDQTVKIILRENPEAAIMTDGLELVRARNEDRYAAIGADVRAARAAGTSKQHLMRDFRIGLHALNRIIDTGAAPATIKQP